MSSSHGESHKFWKEVVIYQVFPRSFKDSNGDGVGDLNGLTSKLDYIAELGATCIWLCPVYRTPNKDQGYDVSDYQDIEPEFGTLQDWERLVAEAHRRNIKIVMDLVINHTSDQHGWFLESRKARDSPKRDWFIWHPGHKDPVTGSRKEPNNWESMFVGSAWTWDETSQEYYLHLFTPQQPDLNWENDKVRKALHDMVQWWCEKGVDGFRLDAINVISKAPGLPDAPIKNPDAHFQYAGDHYFNGPKFLDWMRQMRKDVFDKFGAFTVGETPHVELEQARRYAHETDGAFSMLFQFDLMDVDIQDGEAKWEWEPWQLAGKKSIKGVTKRWQTGMEGVGWNSNYFENHDMPRGVSRFGDDSTEALRSSSAKLLCTWLMSLKGTPFIYQGQELGMTNSKFAGLDEYRDVETFNFYNEQKARGKKSDEEIWASIRRKGRDNTRTPVQWDDSDNAGFCAGGVQPWIKVNHNYRDINAARQAGEPDSVLAYYKRMIRLRREQKVLVYGRYTPLAEAHPEVYAFLRTGEGVQALVLLNWSRNPNSFRVEEEAERSLVLGTGGGAPAQLLISNFPVDDEKADVLGSFELRPYEARVYLLRTQPA